MAATVPIAASLYRRAKGSAQIADGGADVVRIEDRKQQERNKPQVPSAATIAGTGQERAGMAEDGSGATNTANLPHSTKPAVKCRTCP